MGLYLKAGTSSLLSVSGSLANAADCCCECCYDDRTSIDIIDLTDDWAPLNGTYSLSPVVGGNCASQYGGLGTIGCTPSPSQTYHLETISVGTLTSAAGPFFIVSITLVRCEIDGSKTSALFNSSTNLPCGQTEGISTVASGAGSGIPSGVNWENLT